MTVRFSGGIVGENGPIANWGYDNGNRFVAVYRDSALRCAGNAPSWVQNRLEDGIFVEIDSVEYQKNRGVDGWLENIISQKLNG